MDHGRLDGRSMRDATAAWRKASGQLCQNVLKCHDAMCIVICHISFIDMNLLKVQSIVIRMPIAIPYTTYYVIRISLYQREE